jgi:dTDP-4-amino-4,6-dideoxygalactose transaminase
MEDDDIQAVSETLKTGYLVQGAQVKLFEEKIAAYVGTKYAVAVSNCTAALHLALLSLDVGPKDIVVVTAYSWIATANVIELCGAQPVFVDIDPRTFNMSADALQETLTKLMSVSEIGKRVKAILPVHTFGLMADLTAIQKIAQKYNLPVVEDAACALGADIDGKKAGAWGIMGCFSFHPRKAITMGEGGVITTNHPDIDQRLRSLRNHGMDMGSPMADFVEPGYNYRITEFQAALGFTQMNKLERVIRARRMAAQRYDLLLSNSMISPGIPENQRHVYQSYVILLPKQLAKVRTELIDQLKMEGIETTIGTRHMPLAKYYAAKYGYKVGDFPVTDDVYGRSLTLPLYEGILDEEQAKVIDRLLAFEKKISDQ